MNTGNQFTGTNFTGSNNLMSGFTQNTGFGFGGIDNTPVRNPLSSRYPELSDEEIEELRKAANMAGFTGDREQEGMDMFYRNNIKQYVNNKNLDKRGEYLNQQCNQLANYSGSDKKAMEQAGRINALAHAIKIAYNDVYDANQDDCDVITDYIGATRYNKQYDDYINGDDSLLQLVEKGKKKGVEYTAGNKGFWEKKAGIYAAMLGGLGTMVGTTVLGIKGLAKASDKIKEYTKGVIGDKINLKNIGEKIYADVIPDTEKDRRLMQSWESDKLLLSQRKQELEGAQKELAEAKKLGYEAQIAKVQEKVSSLENQIGKLATKVDKEPDTLVKTAIEYKLDVGAGDIGASAGAAKKKVGQDIINPVLEKSTRTVNARQIMEETILESLGDNAELANNPEAIKAYEKAANELWDDFEKYGPKNLDNMNMKELHDLKSSMEGSNTSLYNAKALGTKLDPVDEAKIKIRESVIKKYRQEIYDAGNEVIEAMGEGGKGIKFEKALGDYSRLKEIEDLTAKQKAPKGLKNKVKDWAAKKIQSKAGGALARQGEGAEAVTEATKGAEIAGEATKGAEVVSEAIKGAEEIAEEGIKEELLKGNVKGKFIKKGREQIESRVGKMFAKQGKRANTLKDVVNKGVKTLLKDGGKNAKALLKKGVKGLLDPVAIIMPDSRDIIDSQKLGIPTLKRIASGNPNYTDRKMEELLNKEGATYDTAIAEMLDHLKNNDEFNRTATWLKKNRVTTYREAVEDLWNEDPDELIELFESYLESKKGNGGR